MTAPQIVPVTARAPRLLLAQTAHRPWPLPRGSWVMRQTWSRLLFMHWPVRVEALRPFVPAGLDIETFDGMAWLGVVPFLMSRVRPRGLPSVPWLSAFPELNVRTYVTADGKPGVWFFSLDAGNPVAVRLARGLFHLPYFDAHFTLTWHAETISYRSRRTHHGSPHASLDVIYGPAGPLTLAPSGSLDAFLTERYCLYSADSRGQLYRGEIHHARWPLRPAHCELRANTMASAAGVALPDQAPLVHYAERLDVLVWPLRPV